MFEIAIEAIIEYLLYLHKTKILENKNDRKKIGREVMAMERIISNLRKNATLVESELRKLICQLQDGKDCDLYNLCCLLDKQVFLIREIQEILHGRYSYHSILRVNDYDGDLFEKLINGKLCLVEMMKASISCRDEEIPMTFDLSSYGTYYEIPQENNTVHRHLHFNTFDIVFKMENGEMRFSSKDRQELLDHLIFLHKQVIDFDSVNKLKEAHKTLAKIINEKLNLEEIVSESDDLE